MSADNKQLQEDFNIELPYEPEVTLCSSFRDSYRYWLRYKESVLGFDYPKEKINIRWIDNGSLDASLDALRNFKTTYGSQYKSIEIEEVYPPEIRTPRDSFENLVSLFNNLREKSLALGTDMVIMASDIQVVPPGLKMLVRTRLVDKGDIGGGMTVVAGGMSTLYGKTIIGMPDLSVYFPQPFVEMFISISAGRTSDPYFLAIPKKLVGERIQVGAVGTGFSIIGNHVLKDIPFSFTGKFGEDMQYMWDAYTKGYKIIADLGLMYDHLHFDYAVCHTVNDLIIYVKGTDRGEPLARVTKASAQEWIDAFKPQKASIVIKNEKGEILDITEHDFPTQKGGLKVE